MKGFGLKKAYTYVFFVCKIITITMSCFSFLLLQVKAKQERYLKVKSFAPPYVCLYLYCFQSLCVIVGYSMIYCNTR